jgi:hypothetical protein
VIPPRPDQEQPHPELQRRSLFVCGVRDAVSAAHVETGCESRSKNKEKKRPSTGKQATGTKTLKKSPGKKQLSPPKGGLLRRGKSSMAEEEEDKDKKKATAAQQPSARSKYVMRHSSVEDTAQPTEEPLYALHSVVEARYVCSECGWYDCVL